MKNLLAISLLLVSANCFGSEFPPVWREAPMILCAKGPSAVHFSKIADAAGKPEIKEYIVATMYGKKWKSELQNAQEKAATSAYSYTYCAPSSFEVMRVRLEAQAKADGRKDVEAFVRTHMITKKIITEHMALEKERRALEFTREKYLSKTTPKCDAECNIQ